MSETITFSPAKDHADLPAYEANLQLQVELGKSLRGWFVNELSLGEAAYYAMTRDISFLDEDNSYCGHVYYKVPDSEGELVEEQEVSLYDDLYWERHETQTLDGILDRDFWEWKYEKTKEYKALSPEERLNLIAEYCAEFADRQTPDAAVARDLIKQGTGEATFDW